MKMVGGAFVVGDVLDVEADVEGVGGEGEAGVADAAETWH